MKIIYKKEYKKFARFLKISGIGSLYLSVIWYMTTFNEMSSVDDKLGLQIFVYYIINSVLLIVLGVLLSLGSMDKKFFGIYSKLSITLGTLVSLSLFFYPEGIKEISDIFLGNLFIATTLSGMIPGFIFGGTILVPMFLYGVYASAINGIKYLFNKIDYSNEEETKIQTNQDNGINKTPENVDKKTNKLKVIPILAIVFILPTFFSFLSVLNSSGFNFDLILNFWHSISILILSTFILINKNPKIDKIGNIFIIILFFSPLLVFLCNYIIKFF